MDIKSLILAGNLQQAREQLTAGLKQSPSNHTLRTMLFQVLLFFGELDKAQTHLNILGSCSQAAETGHKVYSDLILAEKERREVFQFKKKPSFLPEAPDYWDDYLNAMEHVRGQEYENALELIKKIDTLRPEIKGSINDESFNSFTDTDTFLSCFIEIFEYERYLLVPVESIREIIIEPPQSLFDLIWIKGNITTWNNMTIGCFLPVLYPESYRHDDEMVKMGKLTDWKTICGSFSNGMGQHVYQVDDKELPILEIRKISFNNQQGKTSYHNRG